MTGAPPDRRRRRYQDDRGSTRHTTSPIPRRSGPVARTPSAACRTTVSRCRIRPPSGTGPAGRAAARRRRHGRRGTVRNAAGRVPARPPRRTAGRTGAGVRRGCRTASPAVGTGGGYRVPRDGRRSSRNGTHEHHAGTDPADSGPDLNVAARRGDVDEVALADAEVLGVGGIQFHPGVGCGRVELRRASVRTPRGRTAACRARVSMTRNQVRPSCGAVRPSPRPV